MSDLLCCILGPSNEEGIAVAEGLMRDLEIDQDQLVDRAYVDLLLAGGGQS